MGSIAWSWAGRLQREVLRRYCRNAEKLFIQLSLFFQEIASVLYSNGDDSQTDGLLSTLNFIGTGNPLVNAKSQISIISVNVNANLVRIRRNDYGRK